MNRQIYEEASEWLVEVRSGDIDAAGRERFDAWLRASPQHIQAFLELSGIWEEGSDPDVDSGNSRDRLIERALLPTNIVAFESAAPPRAASVTPAPSIRLFPRRVTLAASFFACAVALGIYLYAQRGSYATDLGEQRTIALEDGSSVELNSRSRVRVRYSSRERDVDLVEGQALFRVARDSARPFVVRSDSTRVKAVGTEFDVDRHAAGTTVTVVEGRVAVYAQEPASAPLASATFTPPMVLVDAGQQVLAAADAVTKPKHADVTMATAWTQRELVFDATPLARVAQEFNRYNTRQLVVVDDRLRDFHVTGIFSSTDPSSLLRFLRAQPEIALEEQADEIRISSK